MWWQQIKRPLLVVGTFAASALLIVLIVGIIGGYLFNWNWTGLHQKTLWDWLQLLIIPVVLGIGGFWLSQLQKSNEQRTTTDNQREAALQGYFDRISELLLNGHLGELTEDGKLKPEYEKVQEIARARTLTVLTQLDAGRKLSLVRFLAEARLLGIIRLNDVDLSGIHLHQIVLTNFQFRDANLTHAVLTHSILEHLDLSNSNISHADMSHSSLTSSNLSYVNLSHAKIAGSILNCVGNQSLVS